MTNFKIVLSIVASILLLVLIYFLGPILTPFLLALLIAYLLNPIVNQLTKWHIPRLLSVILIFLITTTVLTLSFIALLPIFEKQVSVMINKIPDMLLLIQNAFIPWIETHFGIHMTFNVMAIKTTLMTNWKTAGGLAKVFVNTISSSGHVIIQFLINFLIMIVVSFYLMRDWNKLLEAMIKLIPHQYRQKTIRVTQECDQVLASFFKGQLLVMGALGIIYSTGLWIVGLNVALLVGMMAGLVAIVPYLGFIVGISISLIAALVQFHSIMPIIGVMIVFGVGQCLESMLLTPWLVGDKLGLHPVAVIFAILAGGQLFGMVGVLLALPVGAIILVLLHHLTQPTRRHQGVS